MTAVTLTASPSVTTASMPPAAASIPGALRQFFHKIEEQRRVNLRVSEDLHCLKADLESKWRIASSEGHTSSTLLYEILEHGWKEWRRITA